MEKKNRWVEEYNMPPQWVHSVDEYGQHNRIRKGPNQVTKIKIKGHHKHKLSRNKSYREMEIMKKW